MSGYGRRAGQQNRGNQQNRRNDGYGQPHNQNRGQGNFQSEQGRQSGGGGGKQKSEQQIEEEEEDIGCSAPRTAADGSLRDMPSKKMRPWDGIKDPKPSPLVDEKVFVEILNCVRKLKDVKDEDMKEVEFPLRAAYNDKHIVVHSNHFKVDFDFDIDLHEYSISGIADKTGPRTTKLLIEDFIRKSPFLQRNQNNFVTDYRQKFVLWAKHDTDDDLGPVNAQSAPWKTSMQLSLVYLDIVKTNLLKSYAKGTERPTKAIQDQIEVAKRCVNMLVATDSGQSRISFKANKFFVPEGHRPLSDTLCTIRGYFYSVRPAMGHILLNLNACTSAFFRPIPVSEFLKDRSTFSDDAQKHAMLRGLRVHLTYTPKTDKEKQKSQASPATTNLIKTIQGVGNLPSKQTFQLRGRDGKPDKTVTVSKYFFDTYNIRAGEFPTINCGTAANPSWFLAEHLEILPFQIFKRKVPDSLTSLMIKHACHGADMTRALVEHEGLPKLGLIPGASMSTLNPCSAIKIDARLLKINATELAMPRIKYSNKVEIITRDRPTWNLTGKKFMTTIRKKFNVYIIRCGSYPSAFQDAEIQGLWSGFQAQAEGEYKTAIFTKVGDGFCKPADLKNAFTGAIRTKQPADFFILALKRKDVNAYSIFKELADRVYGVQSVCVVLKFGMDASYWANIAMKVNLKTGGAINHTVDGLEEHLRDTLVLGADVTHPGAEAYPGTPSIAAIVGSINSTCCHFYGSMRLQPRDTACEDIKYVKAMVTERIQSWFSKNSRKFPKRILYYRDGVSESQYTHVLNNEVRQIREAFREAERLEAAKNEQKNFKPGPLSITALVVGKRHHVRFFPDNMVGMHSKNTNCRPGLLVDTGVTSPYFRDFYLQAHDGIKGTAKPAHYFILSDDMNLTDKMIHNITMKMCYTYVRSTRGGVSYAPPAYYADRLCERGRCYLRNFLVPGPDTEIANERDNHMKATIDRARQSNGTVDVETEMRAWTLKEAAKTFYGGETVRNPFNPEVARTMFWM